MPYQHGWLQIAEENGNYKELFNHARTAAYLKNSSTLGCGTIYNVLVDGGCPAYRWVPTLVGTTLTWVQQTYVNPTADSAPWYNAAFPESAKALGFWVTEWTGLDSGHVTRASTTSGSYRGGSTLGPASNAGRVMGFEVILLAESEVAMEYLFRWLDATLTSVCATCSTNTILVRRYCPDITVNPATTSVNGVAEMRGVGMIGGSVWGAAPVEQAGCFIRRVNFTLEATDPCMYSPCTTEAIDQLSDWVECFNSANTASVLRSTCRPSCTEMSPACRTMWTYTVNTTAAAAPVVTLNVPAPVVNTGGTQSVTIPLRIRTYQNPYDLDASEICGGPLLAEMYLTNLPAYTAIRYDMAGRKIEYRDAASGDWINGFAFVEANEPGVPRFPALGCGTFSTIIEPSNYCFTPTAVTPDATFGVSGGSVLASAYHPTLGYLIGGDFTTIAGVTQRYMGIYNRFGQSVPYATVFNTVSNVGALAVQPDGKILVGGTFLSTNAVTVNRFVRLLTNATVDPAWDITGTPGLTNAGPTAIVIQASGQIVIGGGFTAVRGTTKNGLARVNANGTHDATFNSTNSAFAGVVGVGSVLEQADGKFLVVGAFTLAFGATVNNMFRVSSNGNTIDAAYNVGGTIGTNATINRAFLQSSGKMIIVGSFTTARGTTVNRVARINTDGTLDATFGAGGTLGVDATVSAVLPLPDGSMILGGSFTTARGVAAVAIVRLTAEGAIHPDWNLTVAGTNAGGIVSTLMLDPTTGKVLVGGTFTVLSGVARANVGRIHIDGTIDTSFPATQTYYPGQMQPTPDLSVQERMGCA